jgi:CheY-like chemotaxis protein
VLLDNKMPKVNGLEVLKAIKSDEQLKTIPVVVLSSSPDPKDVSEFFWNGVDGCVVKPIDFVQFMEMVKPLGICWAAVKQPLPGTPEA